MILPLYVNTNVHPAIHSNEPVSYQLALPWNQSSVAVFCGHSHSKGDYAFVNFKIKHSDSVVDKSIEY